MGFLLRLIPDEIPVHRAGFLALKMRAARRAGDALHFLVRDDGVRSDLAASTFESLVHGKGSIAHRMGWAPFGVGRGKPQRRAAGTSPAPRSGGASGCKLTTAGCATSTGTGPSSVTDRAA